MSESCEASSSTESSSARSFEAPLDGIQRQLQTIDRRLRRFVVQRPLLAVAMAVGAGYLLGRAVVKTR